MVIKQITRNRKNIFAQNLKVILKAMQELEKIGVSNEEISEFLYNWMHKDAIFKSKLTYDSKTRKFKHKSNFPAHLEYYTQLIRKPMISSAETVDEINPKESGKAEERSSDHSDQPEIKENDQNLKSENIIKKVKKKKRKEKKIKIGGSETNNPGA